MSSIKKNIIVLFLVFLLAGISSVMAQAESNDETKKSPSGQEVTDIQKQIDELQRSLNLSLKGYLEKSDEKPEELEFNLQIGLDTVPGTSKRFVVLKSVKIGISGSQATRLEFYFTRTEQKTMFVEKRWIRNPSVGASTDDIQVEYNNTFNEKSEYKYQNLKSDQSKQKLLNIYADHVRSLIKELDLRQRQGLILERKGISKILELPLY